MSSTFSFPRVRVLRSRAAAVLAVAGAVVLSSGLVMMTASSSSAASDDKSYVCKYSGTPGEDERLKGGENPVWVSNSTLTGGDRDQVVKVGDVFADGQGFSVVIFANTGRRDPEPTIEDCPAPNGGGDEETEVVAEVTFRDPTCEDQTVAWSGSYHADAPGVELPSNLVGFEVTGGEAAPGESVEITATIDDDDYEFDNEGQTQVFTHTFGDAATNCETPPTSVSANATFTDPTCAAPGVAWAATVNGAPDSAGDHVSFALQGTAVAGQAVTVVATAEPGYVLTGPSQFPHTFGAVPSNCATTPPAVLPTQVVAPPVVAGTESAKPKPSHKPTKADEPQVLGTQAAVPTAVDAGLGALPAAAPAQGSLLGRLLTTAGAGMVLAAGWLMIGRRKLGAREA